MENTQATPLEAPSPKTGAWNVLLYLAADNNLKDECLYELTQILNLGPMPQVDTFIQFDSGNAITRYDFRKLRIPRVNNGQNDSISSTETNGKTQPENPELDDLAELFLAGHRALMSVSDSALVSGFLEEMISETDSNFVVLSGHGSGAIGEFLPTDNPPRSLDIPTIRLILDSIKTRLKRKIDILGMDSCLMSMVEVCYELHGQVEILIGAEGFEHNTGWPHHKILEIFKDNQQISATDLARRIVRTYLDFYSPYYVSGVSVDHSAIKLAQIDDLSEAINELAKLLIKHFERPEVKNSVQLAHLRAQSYLFEQYTDLWDFCDLLIEELQIGGIDQKQLIYLGESINGWENIVKTSPTLNELIQSLIEWNEIRAEIGAACQHVKDSIDLVRVENGYRGAAFQHSHGLSIYFPWARPEFEKHKEYYQQLAFTKATQWDEFLATYVEKTQRDPRDNKAHLEKGHKPHEMMPKGGEGAKFNPANETRFNPANETRFNPANETRFNPANETRFNPANETRGKMVFTPMIKNLPVSFFKDELNDEESDRSGVVGTKGRPLQRS